MSEDVKTPKAIYDIHKSYLENAVEGPFFKGPVPKRNWAPKEQWIEFLGMPAASPIGIPAGPLLNSKWVALAARLGYDLLTYKTIRSCEHPAHPLPNVVFVDTDGELTRDRMGQAVKPLKGNPQTPEDLAITNSFGNPSRSHEYLQMDIHLATHAIEEGQVLIVSVFGTGSNIQEVREDFVKAAMLAKEAGAHAIEANFSCPNVASGGSMYQDPELCLQLARDLVKAIGDLPLIVKMGIFPSLSLMEDVLKSLAKAGVRAICGINTVPMKVIDDQAEPVLGESRVISGICGSPIRTLALEFIRDAKEIIQTNSLDLEILGCGGISSHEHFDQFLHAGALAALTATGMMWDPFLACKWHCERNN